MRLSLNFANKSNIHQEVILTRMSAIWKSIKTPAFGQRCRMQAAAFGADVCTIRMRLSQSLAAKSNIHQKVILEMFADERPRDVIPPLVSAIEDSELKLIFDAKLGVIRL